MTLNLLFIVVAALRRRTPTAAMATRKSSTAGGATRVSVAATAMIALRKMSLLSELDEEDLGGADEARSVVATYSHPVQVTMYSSETKRFSERLESVHTYVRKTAPPQRRNSRDEDLPVLS